jgi:hypothetical protein
MIADIRETPERFEMPPALQVLKKHDFTHRRKKNNTSIFRTCKSFIAYGSEGFQRATGKALGRAAGAKLLATARMLT